MQLIKQNLPPRRSFLEKLPPRNLIANTAYNAASERTSICLLEIELHCTSSLIALFRHSLKGTVKRENQN